MLSLQHRTISFVATALRSIAAEATVLGCWSESNRLFRAPKARGAPFPFIPISLVIFPATRVGFEPDLFSLKD